MISVHLLDVEQQECGDAVPCEFGSKRVMIDAGHPGDDHPSGDYVGIAAQLPAIFGHPPPFKGGLRPPGRRVEMA